MGIERNAVGPEHIFRDCFHHGVDAGGIGHRFKTDSAREQAHQPVIEIELRIGLAHGKLRLHTAEPQGRKTEQEGRISDRDLHHGIRDPGCSRLDGRRVEGLPFGKHKFPGRHAQILLLPKAINRLHVCFLF